MAKALKNLEEKYLKEIDEIIKKYPVDESNIKMIQEICDLETPEIYIKKSEKVDFCNKQKECCKYLYHKLYDVLEEHELKAEQGNSKIIVEGNEQHYRHHLPASRMTPNSIYDKYDKRQNKSREMIEFLLNKLMSEFCYFYRENCNQIRGNQGEELVANYFSLFKKKYPSRMNVILPIKDEFANSSEIDSIIITPKGILVCEIKNWGNEKSPIYIHRDDSWYIRRSSGRKDKQKNPFEQNIRHVIALEKFLKQNGITCKIIPVVVIADSKVNIINDGNSKTVLKSSAVYEYIENQPLLDTIDEQLQKKILDLLDNLNIEENSFPCKDIISISDKYEDAIYKLLKLRKTECALEKELFEKCTKIIDKYNLNNPVLWIIIAIVCLVLAGILIFIFRGAIKFIIAVLILGLVCGGGSIFSQ